MIGINWETLRQHTGLRIVADEAARLALESLSGELIVGDVVVEQLSGLSWRYTAPNTWVPYASGGLTYVGRQGLLPNPATTVLTDGQLFVIKTDFGGEDLYRLVAWDESIPARNAQDPTNIQARYTNTQPTIGVPTIAEIELYGITGVTAASGEVDIRISTATTPGHIYQYPFQPGETLNQIAAGIASAYDQSGSHDPDTIAQARGSKVIISGNPGAPALPPRTVQGQQFGGTALTDATLAQFINSANRLAGDYIINDGPTPLTTPEWRHGAA